MIETHNPANSQKSTAAMQHLPPIQTSTELRSLASKPFSIQFLKYFIRTNLILKHKIILSLALPLLCCLLLSNLNQRHNIMLVLFANLHPFCSYLYTKLKHENKNNLRTLPHRNILGVPTNVELWCDVMCCVVLCCVVLWCDVMWCDVMCCAVLCCAVLCCVYFVCNASFEIIPN